jgi:hypothetical protein
MAPVRRISIGFRGGQVVAVRIGEKQLQSLYAALEKGGWHVLEGEDGPVRVALDQVVYISADSEEPHVGFG